MYNPDYKTCCKAVTAEQFCEYLREKVKPDAVMHVCGIDEFYMHVQKDGSVFSVDVDSLDDLQEYEGED